MTKKKSHEDNVRYIYQFYKDTGQHDKAKITYAKAIILSV